MYHSSNFITKFGRYDNNFIQQYRQIDTNTEQAKENIRRTYFDTTIYDWGFTLSQNPIEIPVGITFGHLINGDFSSGYSTNPIGYIEGYYYE